MSNPPSSFELPVCNLVCNRTKNKRVMLVVKGMIRMCGALWDAHAIISSELVTPDNYFDNDGNMFLLSIKQHCAYLRFVSCLNSTFSFLSSYGSFEEDFLAIHSTTRGRSKLQDVRKVMPRSVVIC